MSEALKLVIVGSGPAGLTAAIYAARADLEPLVIAGNLPGGLLTQTSEVENFPGFPDGVDGVELMMHMQRQAERFGARIESDEAASVALSDGGVQKIRLAGGRELAAKALIVAVGATPRHLGIPSEEKFRNRGVSYCATCDGAFYRELPVAVIGGGDSAMEEATFLTRFASRVYVVHRRRELRASRIMAERARKNPKIEFVWNAAVAEIRGGDQVESLLVRDVDGGGTREIACRACFVALGHEPDTALFRPFLETDDGGYLILREGSRTSLAGVFAAGDCADRSYRQAVTAAGMGCRAAIDAERYLS